MKRIFFLVISLFVTAGLFAQDDATATESNGGSQQGATLTSKKGHPILPQAGDYAFGIDVSPFVNLVGNLVKINSITPFSDPMAFNFINNNAIYGKYFLSSSTAIRARIRIQNVQDVTKTDVADADTAAEPGATVVDKTIEKYTTIFLSGGIEKRMGKTRLQGFYGADLTLAYEDGDPFSPNIVYKYGNPLVSGSRVLKENEGGTFGIGAMGFIGAEYFLAPKIAIGGQLGWGFMYYNTFNSVVVQEQVDPVTNLIVEEETEFSNGSSFNLDTDNFGGEIYLMFHF